MTGVMIQPNNNSESRDLRKIAFRESRQSFLRHYTVVLRCFQWDAKLSCWLHATGLRKAASQFETTDARIRLKTAANPGTAAPAGHISNNVISGRQLKRIGTGNQPMPGLTYSGPAAVRNIPRS